MKKRKRFFEISSRKGGGASEMHYDQVIVNYRIKCLGRGERIFQTERWRCEVSKIKEKDVILDTIPGIGTLWPVPGSAFGVELVEKNDNDELSIVLQEINCSAIKPHFNSRFLWTTGKDECKSPCNFNCPFRRFLISDLP